MAVETEASFLPSHLENEQRRAEQVGDRESDEEHVYRDRRKSLLSPVHSTSATSIVAPTPVGRKEEILGTSLRRSCARQQCEASLTSGLLKTQLRGKFEALP